jgi:hypothetical protein
VDNTRTRGTDRWDELALQLVQISRTCDRTGANV